MSEILKINNLTKKYGQITALNEVNYSVSSGKIIGLLGPNGSGKTTLIKLISGLLFPSKGEIFVNEKQIGIESKKAISYLPDRIYFEDYQKVSDLTEMFKDYFSDFDSKKANMLIADLDIDKTQKVKALSKGTKEKLQLCLAMSRNAKLYLLDEPIGGIDPAARDYVLKTILEHYNKDAAVIISTHQISDIEKILDEIIFLKNGEITREGSVDEIRTASKKSIDELFREEFKC